VAVVLDTDHLSILLQETQPACRRLLARLDRLPADDIATTIVCFQEAFQGWLAHLNRARKDPQVLHAYAELECHLAIVLQDERTSV
jgi:hypothetical protein